MLITFMLNHLYESAKLGFTVDVNVLIFSYAFKLGLRKVLKSEAVDDYFSKNLNRIVENSVC